MGDCLSPFTTSSISFRSVPVNIDSDIFNAVADMVGAVDIRDTSVKPPKIVVPDIGAEVGDSASASLESAIKPSAGSPPSGSLTLPSLSAAAYSAIKSVIEFPFESPEIPDVTYATGKSHLDIPDSNPEPPPVDYPQEDLLDLPEAPTLEPRTPPELTIDERQEMLPITMRDYVVDKLEPMDLSQLLESLPDVSEIDVEDAEYPDYDQYEGDEALREQIRKLISGNDPDELLSWVSAETVRELVRADMLRQDLELKARVDDVFRDAAARGFALPLGAVDAQVQQLSEQALDERMRAHVGARKEVMDAATNLVVEGLQQAVTIEQYHWAEYLSYVRRTIQTYRLNLGIAQAAYNSLVEIYNTIRRGVLAQVDAYRQYIQAQSEQSRALGLQAQLTQARVENFQSEVRMFSADVGVLQAAGRLQAADAEQRTLPLEVYEAELQGTLANLQIIRQNVSAFRQAIDNYSQATDWYSDAVSSFEAAVQAESSHVGVTEENLRAHQRLWGAEGDRIRAYESYVSDTLGVANAEIRRFESAAGAQRQYLQDISSSLGDSLAAASAWADMVSQAARATQAYNSAQTTYTAGMDRAKIADGDLKMTQQSLNAAAEAERLRLQAARDSVRVRAAGALAQAASSVHQVSLSGSGTATEAADGSMSTREQRSVANRRSWSKQCISEKRALRG